uniref:malate synthase n=1 Tax=Chromera velia CCMP2878 TaxID=1169474 RepID=A0A0G4F5A9_9ALVE|eukprot:Cvel_155.t1-p1 / transcript=Cvel_155.t1 / gene=Cvel_155 / organism=Chromera_velia_CCMP2878 / gene_product=Malate synthase, glyoxysomal, putative / transcript_product=Malate synthase, glyoxysomal, putative / location=Cvel_scaffold10:65557-71536(-) / protein_length=617 / sequence_SO=supercontig / SO=protein_coding / is_pseudo=false
MPLSVEVLNVPEGYESICATVFSPDALHFLGVLTEKFREELDQVFRLDRAARWQQLQQGTCPLEFKAETAHIRNDPSWKVAAPPPALRDRRVDLGDVDPSDGARLQRALSCREASGTQVDFDDGCCPTWRNVLVGHFNIWMASRDRLDDCLEAPREGVKGRPQRVGGDGRRRRCENVLMFRPRAWNMTEANVIVGGERAFGALLDFGLFVYHNGKILAESGRGPFLYLSKLECAREAEVWGKIFSFSEETLGLKRGVPSAPSAGGGGEGGAIRACVLVESLTLAFEAEETLFALRNHSAGLNCGLWDYAASFIARLGARKDWLFPDRNRYVSMEQSFLASYRRLVVETCHRRGATATGGMVAQLLEGTEERKQAVLSAALSAKRAEAAVGADGGLVYDIGLAGPVRAVFSDAFAPGAVNQIERTLEERVTAPELLNVPRVETTTLSSLTKNARVGVKFIEAWLCGRGHFGLDGTVEDSATAEISRTQIWQQIRHAVPLEEEDEEEIQQRGGQVLLEVIGEVWRGAGGRRLEKTVCAQLVRRVVTAVVLRESQQGGGLSEPSVSRLVRAGRMFLDLVTRRECPTFLTTYLEEQRVLGGIQEGGEWERNLRGLDRESKL